MKRISAELSESQIIELISKDSIGRNQEVADFLRLLDEVEGGYSFFLNAAWGDGKTVFVKQAALSLAVFNENLPSGNEEHEAIQSAAPLSGFAMKDSYMPVYYNSWKNDSLGDPLPTLVATIATEYELQSYTKENPKIADAITGILDAILKPFGLNLLADARAAISGEDYLKAFNENKKLQEKVSELIGLVLEERANKLVLFIDEIDRCSPSFALKLLEEIKFLFEDDRVVLVFSTDMRQLASAVSGHYGNSFDGARYLGRFYDRIIPLSKPAPTAYLATLGVESSQCLRVENYSEYLNLVITDLSNVSALSMRETNCYLESLDKVQVSLERAPYGTNSAILFFCAGIVPVLMLVKLRNIMGYGKVVDYADPEPIVGYLKESSAFKQLCETAVSCIANESLKGDAYAGDGSKLVADLCNVAFGNDLQSEECRLACGRVGYQVSKPIRNLVKQVL